MPFGLKTACATFIRFMHKVLDCLKNMECCFDNVVIHNAAWDEHLKDFRVLLCEHGLTDGINKSLFGFSIINFLGFHQRDNKIESLEESKSNFFNDFTSNEKGAWITSGNCLIL